MECSIRKQGMCWSEKEMTILTKAFALIIKTALKGWPCHREPLGTGGGSFSRRKKGMGAGGLLYCPGAYRIYFNSFSGNDYFRGRRYETGAIVSDNPAKDAGTS